MNKLCKIGYFGGSPCLWGWGKGDGEAATWEKGGVRKCKSGGRKGGEVQDPHMAGSVIKRNIA